MATSDYRPQADKTRVEKALQAFAQTRLGGLLFVTVLPAIDKRLIPATGGRLSTGFGQPLLLLHTRGAKSGIERTTPLLATITGEQIILIASKAGASHHPAWFHNLRANPDVEVTLKGRRRAMRARVAEGEERERLWAIACDHYTGYAAYQTRTPRKIPVVVLAPAPRAA
jgi:deazaflavin-dependent oxidoreductase (nitroreductase family)